LAPFIRRWSPGTLSIAILDPSRDREGAVLASLRADVRSQTTPEPRLILRYRSFSHLDAIDPPDAAGAEWFDDPLMPMRRVAAELAGVISDEN
jgi:hypothetical protein